MIWTLMRPTPQKSIYLNITNNREWSEEPKLEDVMMLSQTKHKSIRLSVVEVTLTGSVTHCEREKENIKLRCGQNQLLTVQDTFIIDIKITNQN